jgi:hypothetical protein
VGETEPLINFEYPLNLGRILPWSLSLVSIIELCMELYMEAL